MRVLLVQLTTGADPAANRPLVRDAVTAALDAAGPVDLVVLPEATQADFGTGDRSLAEVAEPLDGPFVTLLRDLARDAGATMVAGLFERRRTDVPFNTLAVVGPDGALVAAYRKAHLYDAFGYQESSRLSPGEPAAVTVDLPGHAMRVGLMTCYDLRFPEHARALVDGGADLLLVPAAWVRGPAKERHWTTLLAARAIENTVYVAGAAKAGDRYCGLSQVIDPMGVVVAGLAESDGWLVASLTPARVQDVRTTNPSLVNRRWSVVPGPPGSSRPSPGR